MGGWFIAFICGVAGACAGDLLELRTSLIHDHQYPWEQSHGLAKPLGAIRYAALVTANLLLGAAAAVAVYGQDVPARGGLPGHTIIILAASGLAAPAILQKLGGAMRR